MKDAITNAFDESIRVKQAFLRDNLDTFMGAIEAVRLRTLRRAPA